MVGSNVGEAAGAKKCGRTSIIPLLVYHLFKKALSRLPMDGSIYTFNPLGIRLFIRHFER